MADSNATANATTKPRKSAASKGVDQANSSAASASAAGSQSDASSSTEGGPRERFAKAIEEAKAGAQALKNEAHDRAGAYRDRSGEWVEEARAITDQAKVRAGDFANQGKARASGAIASLGKIVADNAGMIEQKFGIQYADYARQAASTMQETATRLDEKSLDEIGDDAREFVRTSPGLAIGLAAAAGFVLARAFKKSDD